GIAGKAKLRSEWIFPFEVRPHHGGIHHRDQRRSNAVLLRNYAPGKQRNSERGKVSWAHQVGLRLRLRADGRRRLACNQKVVRNMIAAHRQLRTQRSAADAGKALQLLLQLGKEFILPLNRGIAIRRQLDVGAEDSLRVEAGISTLQLPQGPEEQARG